MKLFIDTSIFVDVLRSEQVESSKSLFNRIENIKAITPEELGF